MKPLPRAALTEEDSHIWYGRSPLGYNLVLRHISIECDRRDAALMLEVQQVAEWGPAAIELHGIACRGWNDRGYWIEDTDDGEGIWQRD